MNQPPTHVEQLRGADLKLRNSNLRKRSRYDWTTKLGKKLAEALKRKEPEPR
jgi:hypothetical protein